MLKPTIICLTPVRNEAWILERFLKCASLWADHIIIADQNSDDGSVEIAARFNKVTVIQNPSTKYDEKHRQKVLIEAARKFDAPRLLITLDVDEFLTPNFDSSPEWQTILGAPAGTVIRFQWANIKPDMTQYWSPPYDFPWGFMDDSSEHKGDIMHSTRIPMPENAFTISLRDIKVMHYQYTDWERMLSKHRWYQCWERLNNPKQSAISIYRRYHHMHAIAEDQLHLIPPLWINNYAKHGIDMTSIHKHPYRWDKEVTDLIMQYGAKCFAKEDIWDADWKRLAEQLRYAPDRLNDFRDPRGTFLKIVHHWLRKTQPHANRLAIKIVDRILSALC